MKRWVHKITGAVSFSMPIVDEPELSNWQPQEGSQTPAYIRNSDGQAVEYCADEYYYDGGGEGGYDHIDYEPCGECGYDHIYEPLWAKQIHEDMHKGS